MPRPPVKRSKLNLPNQAAKRVANNPLNSSPAARHRQLQEQLAHKDIGHVPNDSDDSDRLVTKSRNPRNRRGVPRREIYGSGGVADGDHVAAHKSPARTRQHISPVQAPKVSAQADDARKPTAPARKGGLNAVDSLSVSKPAEPLRAAAAAAAAAAPPPTSARSSPLGLTSSVTSRVLTQQTPAAERSILGPVKIRKRQPSILQSIDAPDSPILDEYLDDFLPNDESTPLHISRKRKLSATPKGSTPAPPAQSTPQTNVLETCAQNITSPEPDLPPAPSSAISQRRQPLSELDSDTFAPPRSSSSAPSLVKAKKPPTPKNKVNTRKAKEPRSLSTTALQALMPARRPQRSRRARGATATSEFDIPEDSSDAQDNTTEGRRDDSGAEESYIVSPRPTKGRKRKAPAKLRNDQKPPAIIRKQISADSEPQRGGRSSRLRKASTQSPSTSRATAAAKTSSQQQLPAPTDKSVRAYSRPADQHRSETFVGGGEEEDDKENRPSASFGGSAKRQRGRRRDGGHTSALGNEPSSPGGDDDDVEIEVGRGGVGEKSGDGEDEQARLAKKFQEVDEWEMDFEDVTFDGEGSDPLAR